MALTLFLLQVLEIEQDLENFRFLSSSIIHLGLEVINNPAKHKKFFCSRKVPPYNLAYDPYTRIKSLKDLVTYNF